MRLVGLTILVAIIRIDAVAGSNVLTSRDYGHTLSKTGISTTRYLRTGTDDDNDERAGISVETFKNVFGSTKVTPETIRSWLKEGESADTVFTRLHLTQTGDKLFDNPQFADWVQYVDDLSIKTSKLETPAVSTLTSQYGDATLYKMIEAAKNVPSTENLAKKLQSEQLQHWVTSGKDPGDVYHLFNLDKSGRNILTNPEFATWAKHVDNLNSKHPEELISMIPTLMNYYGDAALFKMAEAAKTVEGTNSIATQLENELIRVWLNSRKTPDKALAELGLGKSVDTILESPILNTWSRYLNDFNSKYPHKKTTMVETFTRTFGDADVAKMLAAAKTQDTTKNIATKLESAQLEMWQSGRKSADDVFKLLQLDQTAKHFIENPLFNTWCI